MQKIIFGIFITSLLLSSAAYAQEVNFGKPALQTVKIELDENGNAHVTHIVEESREAQQISVLRDDFTNLNIADEDGGSTQYAETSGERLGFLIFPSNDRVLVQYDLANAATEKNGLWVWDYIYLASTTFYLPENTSIVFVNSNPILLGEIQGVRCHGCQVMLEYELNSEEKTQQVKWEDKTFDVKILATGEISDLRFDQPNKKISFDIMEKDQYVTLVIPKELLWNPYEVLLDEDKLLKHEFYKTDDAVWLNFRANQTGTVDIIGVSAVPEFPLAGILVLGAAMIFAAKFGSRLSRR